MRLCMWSKGDEEFFPSTCTGDMLVEISLNAFQFPAVKSLATRSAASG